MITPARICKALREVPIEIGRFARFQYPAFVTARAPSQDLRSVPVFMFHSVRSETFRAQVRFLQQNGYETLSLDKFLLFLRGSLRLDRPAVLLTFDDGDRSWYDVAYPVLRDAGMHALGFLVSSFISEADQDCPWLTWRQIREMQASGVFSFGSHTHRHARVFCSDRLVDFMHPSYDQNPLQLDTPWIQQADGASFPAPLGAPLYAQKSQMATARIFLDTSAIRQGCVDWVAQQGGVNFFRRKRWRQELAAVYRSFCRQMPRGSYATSQQLVGWLQQELSAAKQHLEGKLGHPVEHLCLPWGASNATALAVAREVGYTSCFHVSTQRNLTHAYDDPFYIPRLKDDYLQRLPGKYRQSLMQVFSAKARHRRTLDYLY